MSHRHGQSLLKPLLLLSVLGPLVLALVLALIQSQQQTRLLRELTIKHLHEVASAVVIDDDFESQLNRIAERTRTQVSLLDEKGVVIADSASFRIGESVSTNTDVYLARNFGEGKTHLETVRGEFGAVTLRIDPIRNRASYLRVIAPIFGSDPNSHQIAGRMLSTGWFWFTLVLAACVLTAISYQLLRRVRRPLQQITQAIEQLGKLSWERSVDISGRGEIEQLSDAFNRAAESIGSEFQKLYLHSQELDQTSRFLETLLGTMIEGVIAVDARHSVVYANQAATTLLRSRLKPGEIAGRQVLEMVRHQRIDQAVRRGLAGEPQVKTEFTIGTPPKTLSLSVTPLGDAGGKGAVLVLQDVTELRRLERLRREFVSNVSHELKTPLAAIQGYTETLLDGAIDDPQANRRFLEGITVQGNRLHVMIQDLLRLGRIEAGNEAFEIQDVAVYSLLQTVIVDNLHLAESKNIDVVLDTTTTDVVVRADPKAVRTIVENLFTNAAKYMTEGSIQLRCSRENHEARIDVIDTGIGIASEHQPRIFERFYRVHESRSRDDGGTGLGLAIVKHLCQVFGGRVEVQSEVGKGSTFSVFLPLAGEPPIEKQS